MRRVMFKTNGTITRHTMSFTKNAEKIPDVKITAGKNRAGLNRRSTTSAIHSKKPTRCRLPTISIIENNRTMVEKSMKCRACAGETTRAAESAAEGIRSMCSQQNSRIRAGNSSISSSPGQFCFPERNGFLSRHFLRRAHQDHADHNDDRGSKNSCAQLFSGQRPAQKNRDDWINVRVSRNQRGRSH